MREEFTPHFLYGTAWKRQETARLTALALENGFRAIDTANQLKHYDEAGVGEGIKRSGVDRKSIYLQTKFTSRDGQDHRLPYDENAPLKTQVAQSFQSSLEHLHTDYIDSYVLHGPYNYPGLGEEDWEVWRAMEAIHKSGAAKALGISNITAIHLVELIQGAKVKPAFVQNRCFANQEWDRDIREICKAQGIRYQGFSLLTANPQMLRDARVLKIADRLQAKTTQVIFAFCKAIGILPLTGTTNPEHMKDDLSALALKLTDDGIATLLG